MEDVGRVPEGLAAAPPMEPTTIPTLDGWIESLMACKQLAESDVQRLCEKVRICARMIIEAVFFCSLLLPVADGGEMTPPFLTWSQARVSVKYGLLTSLLPRLAKFCKTNPMSSLS